MVVVPSTGDFPLLHTERLVLRNIKLADIEAVFNLFSDQDVTRYLDIATLQTLEDAEKFIEYERNRFEQGCGIRWGIVTKDNESLIGTCGFTSWVSTGHARGDLGYDLHHGYWAHGFMTEALKAIIEYGFTTMQFNRIQALVTPGNARSMNVLRKIGFHKEGILREYVYSKGKFLDQICFSLLKREWPTEQMKA